LRIARPKSPIVIAAALPLGSAYAKLSRKNSLFARSGAPIGAETANSRIGRKTGELPGKSMIFRVVIGAERGPEENRDDARVNIGEG
jgi:hypothetical protein